MFNNDQRKNQWFRENQGNSSRDSEFAEPDKSKEEHEKLDIVLKNDKRSLNKAQSPEKQNQIIINLSDI